MGFTLSNVLHCPRCAKTAQWTSDNEVTCDWCNQKYYCDKDGLWEDENGEFVRSEASPQLHALIYIAEYRFHTLTFHFNNDQLDALKINRGGGGWTLLDDGRAAIHVDGSNSETDRILILAHELGHVMNFDLDFKRDFELWEAFKQSPSVTMLREQAAWLYSVEILLEIGFTDWNYFLEFVSRQIGTYYQYLWDRHYQHRIRIRSSKPTTVESKVIFLKKLKSDIQNSVA